MSSTTLLSSTSRIHDALHHRVGVRESLEHRICAMLAQLIDCVSTRCNSDRACTDRFATANVGGCVTDDHDTIAGDICPDDVSCPLLRNAWKLRAMLVIRTECIHLES